MHDESRRAFSLPSDMEIAGLVRRAQQYDPVAFEQIYEHFADTIYLYALYQCLSARTAAAIVTTTFEQAVREIRRLDVPWRHGARHTRNWLLRIAVNQAARYNGATQDDPAGEFEEDPPALLQVDTYLLRALRELEPEQREILVLRLIGRLHVEDIVEITGRPVMLVRRLQAHGLADIAARLYANTALRRQVI